MIGWAKFAQLIALAAFLALPSVILMMLFGQTRIFFVMARDGLLPFGETLSKVHPKFGTPYVVTIITGIAVTIFAAFFPVGVLADISNSGTLFAFLTVSVGVMVLRVRDPGRHRPFRMPFIWLVGPLAFIGCAFADHLPAVDRSRSPDLLPLRLPQEPARGQEVIGQVR